MEYLCIFPANPNTGISFMEYLCILPANPNTTATNPLDYPTKHWYWCAHQRGVLTRGGAGGTRSSLQVRVMETQDQVINTVVYCVLNNIVIVIGILGNLTAVYILSHASLLKVKNIFHQYLLALAVSDLLFLLANLAYGVCNCKGIYNDHPHYISESKSEATVISMVNPLRQLLTGPSDLISVGMTLQRVLVIARLPQTDESRAFWSTVILAYTVSVLTNMPLFWAFQLDPIQCNHPIYNSSSLELDTGYPQCYGNPALGKPLLVAYNFWIPYQYVYVCVMKLCPAISLLVMNFYLITKVRACLKKKQLLKCKLKRKLTISSDPNATTMGSPEDNVTTIKQKQSLKYKVKKDTTEPTNTAMGSKDATNTHLKKKLSLKSKVKEEHTISPNKNNTSRTVTDNSDTKENTEDMITTVSFVVTTKMSMKQRNKGMDKLRCALHEIRLTIVLIALLTSYTLLTSMNTVLTIFWMQMLGTSDLRPTFSMRLLYAPANLLLSCNYSINLYLACAANRDIRRALARVAAALRGYI